MVRITEKHRRSIRWFHWINVPVLSLMIWSGALIYWADQAYLRLPKEWWAALGLDHRLAEGMGWHFFLIWPFLINGICNVLILLITGEWRKLIPYKNDFARAIPCGI